jgi:hypothetical protein
MTQRIVESPSYYNGTAMVDMTLSGSWDFSTDKDVKVQNKLNASAQEECDYSFVINQTAAMTAGYAYAICQQVSEQKSTQPNVAWHYDMALWLEVSTDASVVIAPFVMQNENSDADSTRVQWLASTDTRSAPLVTGVAQMNARGCVIRRKQSVSGSVDANGLVFGMMVWSTNSTPSIQGIGTLSVHPNNLPLVIDRIAV